MKIVSSYEDVERAVLGGAVLGGGGGGSIGEGLRMGRLAVEMGYIKIIDIEELPRNSIIVTTSTVGSQIRGASILKPYNYIESMKFMMSMTGVNGIISSENGALNTVTPWLQAATFNIPIVDVACDGRAHPTTIMGSLGLHKISNYMSLQAFSVGEPNSKVHVSGIVRGSLNAVSKVIRDLAGRYGVVAVTRNPVSKEYLKKSGALKAVTLAMELGSIVVDNRQDPLEETYRLAKLLNGDVIEDCVVKSVLVKVKGGFDVGSVILECKGESYEITFMNEFITLESNGTRIATFPDLITLINVENGLPILSGELKVGSKAHMLLVKRGNIPLGEGLKYSDSYEPLERVLSKEIVKFINDVLIG